LAEEKHLNLYQKLAKIRKAVEVVQKNKDGYGYRYVTDDELLSKITGKMDSLGVSLIPGIVPGTLELSPYSYQKTKFDSKIKEYRTETVNEILVSADTVYTWVNDENPTETVVVPWGLVGQQADASQSFGSGLTYTYRYFLLKYFGVSTVEDDPDSWRSKQREAEETEQRLIAEGIINELDTKIKLYVADNPGKRDDVTKLVTRYVKNGNYHQITEPALAAKLQSDFTAEFLGGK
jgi:hypothetical protein